MTGKMVRSQLHNETGAGGGGVRESSGRKKMERGREAVSCSLVRCDLGCCLSCF